MSDDHPLAGFVPTLVTAGALGLPGPPTRRLWQIGQLPPAPRLAIVGSRAAHRRVLDCLPALLSAAGARGWSLVSGGALGVDAGAHRAALAAGVAQIAVLPCGPDRPYPPGNLGLFSTMAASASAALLFAQPPGTEPRRGMFASRNAIVVGLADAVLVAEAGLRSGSLGTGRQARARGRPLAAIAGSPGCGALIGQGAQALPIPGDGPLAGWIGAFERWLDRAREPAALAGCTSSEPDPRWPTELAWLAAAIARAGPSGLTLDSLPDADAAALALTRAELLGLVCEAAPGRWVRA